MASQERQLREEIRQWLHMKWTSGLNHNVVPILVEDVARFIEEREKKWQQTQK